MMELESFKLKYSITTKFKFFVPHVVKLRHIEMSKLWMELESIELI